MGSDRERWAVWSKLCKRYRGAVCFGSSVAAQSFLAHPAGAARRATILAERRGERKGAPLRRGEANPCARAPFCDLPGFRRAVPRGERLILLVCSERFGRYRMPPAVLMRSPHIVSR